MNFTKCNILGAITFYIMRKILVNPWMRTLAITSLHPTYPDSSDWLSRFHMMQGYCKLEYHWGYFEGTLQLLWQEYRACSSCSVSSKYSTCSSLSGTASYQTYVASQQESGCFHLMDRQYLQWSYLLQIIPILLILFHQMNFAFHLDASNLIKLVKQLGHLHFLIVWKLINVTQFYQNYDFPLVWI